jgi:hypothetical protein
MLPGFVYIQTLAHSSSTLTNARGELTQQEHLACAKDSALGIAK